MVSYYHDESVAFVKLSDAWERAAITSAYVLCNDLKAYSNSDAALVKMADDHEKGLVSQEQIDAFLAKEYFVLKGRITSKKFCREHPLQLSDTPWLIINDGTKQIYVAIYFLLEDVWRHWPFMRPLTAPEPMPAKPRGAPSKYLRVAQAIRDEIDQGIAQKKTVLERAKHFDVSEETYNKAMETLPAEYADKSKK